MKKVVERIVNKQFEMIGVDIRWGNIPEDGLVPKNKKEMIPWFEKYMFRDEKQYREWEKWAIEELKKENLEEEWINIFLIYSMNFPLKKGEQLILEI